MLTQQTRLRPNTGEIAAAIVDGEAIMINLSTGMYYSMDQVGSLMWEFMTAGQSLEEVVASVARRYDVPREQAQADVQRLATQLVEENLVVLSAEDVPPPASPADVESCALAPYSSPKLEIYRDIGHLVALDPPMPGLKDLPWKEATDDSAPHPAE